MQISWTWIRHCAVVLAVGVGTPLCAEDAAKKSTAASAPWWNPWAVPSAQSTAKKLPKANKDEEKEAAARADKNNSPRAKLKTESDPAREREQKTLFRRLDVCDQLKLIANQTGNDSLMRRAEELDSRSWDVYTKRVADLDSAKAAAGTSDLEIDGEKK
jgi:hypothetical protein